jgi:hypothetical protein
MNAVEGVDYIFDRYAYLGISPDSSAKEIRAAIRTLRASAHEDRLQNVNSAILAKAKELNEMADLCAAMLVPSDVRELYDAKLQEFKANKPEFVSTDGRPIICLDAERVDIEGLLENADGDFKKLETAVQLQAGYNPRQLETLKKMAESSPDDNDLQQLYRQQVTRKLAYATVMEECAWRRAGIVTSGPEADLLAHAEDYAEHNDGLISKYRDEHIPTALDRRGNAVAIGMAKPVLLLTFNDASWVAARPERQAASSDAEILKIAQENFDNAAVAIRRYSALKQEAMDELVALTPLHILFRPENLTDGQRIVYLMNEATEEQEPTLMATFNFLRIGNVVTPSGVTVETETVTLSALRQRPHEHPSIAAIHNPEIKGFYLEPIRAVERLGTFAPTP